MRNQLKTFYSALLIVATLGLTSTVHGVPTFARQTGLDCNSCHAASGFPTLNAFGAAFKAGGYSQANEDDLLGDGEALSIPKNLNISVVLKAMNPVAFKTETDAAAKTTTTSDSKFVLPDEMALLIGGRIGKNAGFLIESGLGNDGLGGANSALGAKFVFAPEIGPVRLGIVPWWSDLGAGYIFETMSTGAVNNLRAAEEMKGAAHRIGMNGTAQTGLGLYVWHPMGFVAFSPYFDSATVTANTGAFWGTTSDVTGYTDKSSDNIGYYTRAAVTPSFGDVAMGIGVQYWSGKSAAVTNNSFVIDAQAMMDIGLPLSIYITYGMNSEDYSVARDLFNSGADIIGATGTNYALTAYVEAGIVPDVFMLGLAFAMASDTIDVATTTITTTKTDMGLVAKYHVFRNLKVELDVFYTTVANDYNDQASTEFLILPMIFGAF
jgi:hypothetical protein